VLTGENPGSSFRCSATAPGAHAAECAWPALVVVAADRAGQDLGFGRRHRHANLKFPRARQGCGKMEHGKIKHSLHRFVVDTRH